MKVDELQISLAEASQTQARLAERVKSLRDAVKGTDDDVSRIEAAAKEKAIEDLIANRTATPTESKQLEAARAKAASTVKALHVAQEALNRQLATVQSLQGEIALRRNEIAKAEIELPRMRLEKAMRELASAIAECVSIQRKHPNTVLYDLLYPLEKSTNWDLRFSKMGLCQAAADLHDRLYSREQH